MPDKPEYIPKASDDSKSEKYQRKPGARIELSIQKDSECQADKYRQDHREPGAAQEEELPDKPFLFFLHRPSRGVAQSAAPFSPRNALPTPA
jgi:hypothetical protein